MKRVVLILAAVAVLAGCQSKKTPDVSGIQVSLQVQRFEQDFFALDTNNISAGLQQLQGKYPTFLPDFLHGIMELPPVTDTSVQVQQLLRRFIADYRAVKAAADKGVDMAPVEKQVKRGLQFVKYYFPAYKLPAKLVTFIGPMEGYSDILTQDALAVGLQLHLGKDAALYTSTTGQEFFPLYVSRKFTPDYIVVNCMKNIINDIAPVKYVNQPLAEQMVEEGKRMYVLDKLLPETPDTLKIGYTARQLKWSKEFEGKIWNFFLTNNLLMTNEPALIKDYMNESPHTNTLGDDSPGFIGLFIGWQIVNKYMEKHSDLSLAEVLRTDARRIFEESKYKPN
ncbi:MAG: hypothetical protein QM731_23325 [Chitinophagaceae bacterium]